MSTLRYISFNKVSDVLLDGMVKAQPCFWDVWLQWKIKTKFIAIQGYFFLFNRGCLPLSTVWFCCEIHIISCFSWAWHSYHSRLYMLVWAIMQWVSDSYSLCLVQKYCYKKIQFTFHYFPLCIYIMYTSL